MASFPFLFFFFSWFVSVSVPFFSFLSAVLSFCFFQVCLFSLSVCLSVELFVTISMSLSSFLPSVPPVIGDFNFFPIIFLSFTFLLSTSICTSINHHTFSLQIYSVRVEASGEGEPLQDECQEPPPSQDRGQQQHRQRSNAHAKEESAIEANMDGGEVSTGMGARESWLMLKGPHA